MRSKARIRLNFCVAILVMAGILFPAPSSAAPSIWGLQLLSPSPIPRYGLFEITFRLTTVATNPYLPYDASPPPGVPSSVGASVDMEILPPGQSDWGQALMLPCFWYQPTAELGEGDHLTLVPTGAAQWRARYTPQEIGRYSYRLRARDASGETYSEVRTFDVVLSDASGFCRVGVDDARFFELSDGTPLLSPLVNLEQGSPLNSLAEIREFIPQLAANGLRFVRWFPTGEGANYHVAPYGDDIRIAWQFGEGARATSDGADVDRGKLFSYQPYYYSMQSVPGINGARYRLSFWAKVEGDQVLRAELDGIAKVDIGSATSSYHEARGQQCDYRREGWHYYVLTGYASDDNITAAMRGLYVGDNAPSPYNVERPGGIRLHSVALQRDEGGLGQWGPNLLRRGDPDTYQYVDQRSAALLDEILTLSAENGVYHKLTLFHKNDQVLNRFEPDGTVTQDWDGMNARFYSQDGYAARWYEMAYARYFVGRWSHSTALHSLELANENHLTDESYAAGWNVAEYCKSISPRYILMSNSFWGYFVNAFFQDSTHGRLLDYADQHWYASENETTQGLISNTWNDSAAYAREAWVSFGQTGYGWGPIVRGEGGVAETDTFPQHPDVATESGGVYYHKKVWAHVGSLGWSVDGEWYPRLTSEPATGWFPNDQRDTWDVYAAYARFCEGEPLNNGHYVAVGPDQWGDRIVAVDATAGDLRAWGVRDAAAGKALMWVDNANHTWHRVSEGAYVPPASGSVTLQGLPEGSYAVTWWDTRAGAATSSVPYSVGLDGTLNLSVSDLAEDIAVKIVRVGGPASIPLKQPIPLDAGWNLISLAGVPNDADIADILSPVAAWCDVAWAHDSGGAGSPWKSYAPSAPPYASRLQTLDETMGMWVHMRAPATLLVTGTSCDTDIALRAGWNLVGYPRLAPLTVEQATASIAAQLLHVYAWESTEGGQWECWDAAGVHSECTLTHLDPGRGYWVEVTADCLWEIP